MSIVCLPLETRTYAFAQTTLLPTRSFSLQQSEVCSCLYKRPYHDKRSTPLFHNYSHSFSTQQFFLYTPFLLLFFFYFPSNYIDQITIPSLILSTFALSSSLQTDSSGEKEIEREREREARTRFRSKCTIRLESVHCTQRVRTRERLTVVARNHVVFSRSCNRSRRIFK